VIGSHPRLGFGLLAGVLATLVALGVLIARGGGGAAVPDDLTYDAAPLAPVQQVAPASPELRSTSRSAARTPVRNAGVDPVWARKTGAAAGIPTPAIIAYGSAELKIDKEQRSCHLSWNTLAGIGWIESQHGTLGGRTLGVEGRSSTPIIGPALNGKGYAAIHATPESTHWHGDPTWEHAVGPLQFIASTWDKWGADGDGDGVADPLDIDDAAFTAARYLCADDHDLSTAAGWSAAVHSYNHDDAYVTNVLNAANAYAERTR
jgi:membrane-bound lytic murein transglycosylase B